jgi:capsular polysaccharide biosynthesis protein
VLLGALAGFGSAFLWPAQYGGRASVLYIISQEQPTGFLREDRNLTTQALLVRSTAVLGPVGQQYGLSSEALADKVTVTVPDGSELIVVDVRDASPELAVRVADAVVRQYLQISSTAQPSADQMTYVRTELTKAQERVQQLRTEGTAPALAELPAAADRAGDLSAQLDVLMLAQVSRPQAQYVEPAHPIGQVSPRPGFGAATGAVVGLLVAIVVVALVARRWHRSAQQW